MAEKMFAAVVNNDSGKNVKLARDERSIMSYPGRGGNSVLYEKARDG